MPSALWLMTIYEVFKYYLCYAPAQKQELIVCQVDNLTYTHLITLLTWIICGERTYTSFACYLSIIIVGWIEKVLPGDWA